MFTFFEKSQSSGEPILFYRVTYGEGANDFMALTDAEEDITIEGVKYQGRQAIHCPPITASGTLDKSSLDIEVPFDSPLTELFRTEVPDHVVGLRIFRGHYGDVADGVLSPDNVRQIWGGRILNFEVDRDYVVTLSCMPLGSGMKRAGLRRPYCLGCPHVHYGPQCRADRAAFTVSAEVTAAGGNTVTLAEGWAGAFPPGKFARGVASFAGQFGTVRRTILRVSGNTLTLAGGVGQLEAGATLLASLGCNHTTDDCKDVFDNILNFGGFPWIPTENPTSSKSRFY